MIERLTELEGSVLGLLWDSGPSTPYAIRKVFQDSPSPYWSGSAGAIYPLIRRLEGFGFVRSRKGATGRRQRAICEITADGKRALRGWIGPPASDSAADWAFSLPMDPLRARIRFLALLTGPQRMTLLDLAERHLTTEVRDAEKECARLQASGETMSYLMARGVLRTARARLAWIREVSETV